MSYIHLKTYDGVHYLCAENGGGGPINATRSWAAQWETFRMIPSQGGTVKSDTPVNFSTYDGTHYVCAENGGGGEVNATRQAASIWETFSIHRVDGAAEIANGSKVNLRAYDGHFLCAEGGGGAQLNATRTAAAQWETFTVELIPRSVTFPLHVTGTQRIKTGQWISLAATLADTGRVDSELHVWTNNEFTGFHGAGCVFAVDEMNQILWNSQLHTLGVDGTWIPGLPSSRTQLWNETIPADVMQVTETIRIAVLANPTNMLMRDIDMLVNVGKQIGAIAAVVAAIF